MRQRSSTSTARSNRPTGDEGAALLVVMLGVVVLTAVGVSLVGLGMVSRTMTTSERETAEALAIADAGMAHAKRLVLWQEWSALDQVLQSGNGTACDGDELAGLPLAPVPPTFPTAGTDLIPQAGVAYGTGQYQVFVCDDHEAELIAPTDPALGLPDADPNHDANRQFLIRSVGTGPNGAIAAVEAVVGPKMAPAVIINGDAWLSGTVTTLGAGGGIHTNGQLEVSGNVCAEQYFGSVDDIVVSGGSLGGGAGCTPGGVELEPFSPPLTVPQLTPSDYKPFADYWLENDGTTYDGAGNPIPVPPGLNFNAGQKKWTSVATLTTGTYWVNANYFLNSTPGPMPLTIIAEGYIQVGGTPTTTPDFCPPWPGCIALLAGTDMDIAGGGNSFAGLHYAAHQLEISGTPTFNGQILARNDADTCDTVLFSPTCNLVPLSASGQMHLSGSPTVTYNGGGLTSTTLRKWRECRGPNPANLCGLLFANQATATITLRTTELLRQYFAN